jgi:hypothetical protein
MCDLSKQVIAAAGSSLTSGLFAGTRRTGRVLGSFPAAVYVGLEDGSVLPIVTPDAVVLPTAARIARGSPGFGRSVHHGDDVVVKAHSITLGVRRIRVVRRWVPARVEVVPGAAASPEATTLLTDAASCDHAQLQRVKALISAVGQPDPNRAAAAVDSLVGFGPGLTPAGDDALCGVLLTLHALGATRKIDWLRQLLTPRLARTTCLSASLLRAAAAGYAVPEVARLITQAVEPQPSPCQLHVDLASVLTIGHTSGHAIVAGIAATLAHCAATSPALSFRAGRRPRA